MIIGMTKESQLNEHRVALTPQNVAALVAHGCTVLMEAGAGIAAEFTDESYCGAGAKIHTSRLKVIERADVLVQVNAAQFAGSANSIPLRRGQWLIGMMDPLGAPEIIADLAEQDVTVLAMELIPRISRAQNMDVLSSMAMIAGYKSVLMAANLCSRIYPMMMTAAGTLNPVRLFVMGAGVAGLQAAATAKRMGAVVEAYDVRPAARDQILSVGAKPIELALETEAAEGKGGYAKAQGEEFLLRQRELMSEVLAEQDIVITTAAIPGAKSPVLITDEMVKKMKPGSIIIDLASERGGNCELTQHGETVVAYGVTIVGPENITATVPNHASQLYGKNIENLLRLLLNDTGEMTLDLDDEIIQDTLVCHQGLVCHSRLRTLLKLPELNVKNTLNKEVA